ncbi:PAS domain-containing protein [Kordiimonas aestuarii]|uniref:PAS domain-containing protein n=1 Tax=Kordiimonas aestuarii TaxID=1005925 RepID=UPI0021D3C1D6|nr:PAS domain-containing protein [Kordiimonas aestuarii]
MLSAEVCRLLGYWVSLGGGQTIPERSALDLRQLSSILQWMFILEMGGDGSLRYRLAGSSLESAAGCGMAGKTYSEIFSDHEQAAIMEELYAVALVQSCGLLRTGALSFRDDERFEMEVLALPFVEARAMGGIVLVGVVRPFDSENMGFVDRWGGFRQELSEILVVPSPRVMGPGQLSSRVQAALDLLSIRIKALDVHRLLEIDRKGGVPGLMGVPSVGLDSLSGEQRQTLN